MALRIATWNIGYWNDRLWNEAKTNKKYLNVTIEPEVAIAQEILNLESNVIFLQGVGDESTNFLNALLQQLKTPWKMSQSTRLSASEARGEIIVMFWNSNLIDNVESKQNPLDGTIESGKVDSESEFSTQARDWVDFCFRWTSLNVGFHAYVVHWQTDKYSRNSQYHQMTEELKKKKRRKQPDIDFG